MVRFANEVQRNLCSRSYTTGRFSVKRENGGYYFHQLLARTLQAREYKRVHRASPDFFCFFLCFLLLLPSVICFCLTSAFRLLPSAFEEPSASAFVKPS